MQPWWTALAGAVVGGLIAFFAAEWRARRDRVRARQGHLETIALDVWMCGQQAKVYVLDRVSVPAYRVPLLGFATALPALIAERVLSLADGAALSQFYVDAKSFNYCMDTAQGLLNTGRPAEGEIRRIGLKVNHLLPGVPGSRYDAALEVLRKHLDAVSLQRLELEHLREQDRS